MALIVLSQLWKCRKMTLVPHVGFIKVSRFHFDPWQTFSAGFTGRRHPCSEHCVLLQSYLIEGLLDLVEVIEVVLHRHTDGVHSVRAHQPLPGQQLVQVMLLSAMSKSVSSCFCPSYWKALHCIQVRKPNIGIKKKGFLTSRSRKTSSNRNWHPSLATSLSVLSMAASLSVGSEDWEYFLFRLLMDSLRNTGDDCHTHEYRSPQCLHVVSVFMSENLISLFHFILIVMTIVGGLRIGPYSVRQGGLKL